MNRRNFIKQTAGFAAISFPMLNCAPKANKDLYDRLDKALAQPILKQALFKAPIIIENIDLLHYNGSFICHVRSTDGAEGWSVSNNLRMEYLYPIFNQRVKPFFIGKDVRNLDDLIRGIYLFRSNFKFQSYALWVPVATLEFAILDMLGQIEQKPLGELIGNIHNPQISIYHGGNSRNKSAHETLELKKQQAEESGIKALKFKIGEKMGDNSEPISGRTEELIKLSRKILGDDVWLAVDANGGFRTKRAIEIGKLLHDYKFSFFEEPVPFDWYEETKTVADNVDIIVAGGEMEASMHNFRWLIANKALQIVKPDVFYFGGMIRSMQVANMAKAAGLMVSPHISGSGLGYLYVGHFVSALPNAAPFHPNSRDPHPIPVSCPTSLDIKNGKFTVPKGPGLGVEIDKNFIKKHKPVHNIT